MSGTVILPLPARGATLIETSGAAPRFGMQPLQQFDSSKRRQVAGERIPQLPRHRHQRVARRLLRVSNLAFYKSDLEIFIYVNLLDAQVEDFVRLAEDGDDLIDSLADRNGGWWGWRSRVCCRSGIGRGGCVCRRSRIRRRLLIALVVRLCGIVLLNLENFRHGFQYIVGGGRGAFGVNEFEGGLVTDVANSVGEQGEYYAV